MEVVAQIFAFGDSFLSHLVPFLFVLTVVVFVHEFGHFLVARWCGVDVSVFSIGFGREITGFTDRKGTRWRFCWIPLGGYVKFVGDENAASMPDPEARSQLTPEQRAGSFHEKPLHQRAAIVCAGPVANFLLAILIFTVLYTFVGQQITAPRVDSITEGSAAEAAGFEPDDLIVSIDGTPIESFSDLQRIVTLSADQRLVIEVERDGEQLTLEAVPVREEITDRFGNTMRVGVLGIRRAASQDDWTLERHDPLTSLWLAVQETYFVVSRTMIYLYEVVVGRESADQLRGPIGIAQISGQVATVGLLPLVHLVAFISIAIGLINLFPIPMLDGGHLVFYAIEAARGKPVSDRGQEISFRIGLALVLMLMIFVTWNDLIQIQLL